MKRRAKISYMVVLLAMIMFMGTRIVPHHHCATATDSSVHFGFGDCDGCEHSHGGGHDCGHNDAHSHSETPCFSDFKFFLRIYDDDTFIVKKISAFQPAMLLPESLQAYALSVQLVLCSDDEIPPSIGISPFRSLRAPPVA